MIDMNVDTKIKAELDPGFVPAALWNKAYKQLVVEESESIDMSLALFRPDDTVSVFKTKVLPLTAKTEIITIKFIERLLKFLLWQKGGYKVLVSGSEDIAGKLAAIYSRDGERAFDHEFFGDKVYCRPLEIEFCIEKDMPEPKEISMPLGRNLDGCRIGFDLGGSDRKCAATIDGEVVFSEEIEWNPYFENNPQYHIDGINDSLRRAAAKLPRVDAIGGSSAGVYVNNEVRVASLFRGVAPDDFESHVRRIFFDLKKQWDNIPFEVVNDGEVTALAGSMSLGCNAVFGLSMGTSQAVGYVTPEGNITPWLNELAFAPIDYRDDAPADEWSGDNGCGVQYFSQQGVARLAPLAGLQFEKGLPFSEQLIEVQNLMKDGDERAAKIYSTIGTYFGYSIAHYCEFYDIEKILILGRVTSGDSGSIIIDRAQEVLSAEFPEIAGKIEIATPNEKDKRHGQAVAAASLPVI